MPTGHFTNVVPTATDIEEVLYSNLFELTFTFPQILGLSPDDEQIMMLNSTNIDLNLTEDLNVVEQFFKYSGRQYLQTNRANSIIKDLNIKFNINVNDIGSMRTWNYLKNWYDLGWNSQTGTMHYKSEMIGSIVAHIHDRKGTVVRRVEFVNVQLKGLSGMSFSWETEDIITGEARFIADYWIDQYKDIASQE